MPRTLDLMIDVTEAAGLDEPAHIAATMVLPDSFEPDDTRARILCFARPGGPYARGYFTTALPGAEPGASAGSQALFHAGRGWIFVALDHLGSGASSAHATERLDFATLTATAAAAEAEIALRLANGVLCAGLPPVSRPVRIGIGQSLGGMLAIVQQARHASYDGVAVLGFSAVHSHPATAPGEPPVLTAWFARDTAPDRPGSVINAAALARAGDQQGSAWTSLAWGFHYDDVPAQLVEDDLAHYELVSQGGMTAPPAHPWLSNRTPPAPSRFTLTPGAVAPEAAAIDVPVLSAMGTRDLVADPPGEARAYRSAPSFDQFVCPRMGHMHNFAGTRALLWERIHHFGEWCRVWRDGV